MRIVGQDDTPPRGTVNGTRRRKVSIANVRSIERKTAPRWRRRLGQSVLVVFGALLERCAENIAERSSGIGGAVLGDGLFLFGHFQRLDRHRNLAGLAVELGDAA